MISVIIPTYNNEHTLSRTLESICGQTCSDIEVIVVNDGSTDRTREVAESAAGRDARIRVFSTPNSGAYHARLFGVGQAQGEWIAFADADDTLPADALETLLCVAQSGDDIDIAVGTINLNNRRVFKHSVVGNLTAAEYISAILTGRTSVGPYAKLYRRALFDADKLFLPVRISQNEDLLMLLTVAREARAIKVNTDKIVYNYLFSPGSAARRRSPLSDWFTLFDTIGERIKSVPGLEEDFIVYKINMLYSEGVLKLNDFSGHEARLCKLSGQAAAATLPTCSRKKLRTILSPARRRARGIYTCSIRRTKQFIKKLIGRES